MTEIVAVNAPPKNPPWCLPRGEWVEALSPSIPTIVHWRGQIVGYSDSKDAYLILTPSERLVEWARADTKPALLRSSGEGGK